MGDAALVYCLLAAWQQQWLGVLSWAWSGCAAAAALLLTGAVL